MCLTFHTDFIWSYMKFIWISQEFYKSMWNYKSISYEIQNSYEPVLSILYEFHLKFAWSSYEFHKNFICSSYEIQINCIWNSYEYKSNISYGFLLKFTWSSCISYEVHMKYKRSYYDIHVNMCLIFHLIGSSYVVHMNFTWITQPIRMNLRCTIWEYARVLV